MTPRSRLLLDLAARFAAAQPDPGIVAAYAGGSVGRGEADDYSDLDLMFYHDDSLQRTSARNLLYRGEAIQAHHHKLPTADEVRESPWDFRFILDAAPVHDPADAFAALKSAALEHFASPRGRQQLRAGAADAVERRRAWAADCLREGRLHTGGMAAMAAVSDAAFLYGFADARATSTDIALAYLGDHPQLTDRIVSACPVPGFVDDGEFDRRIAGAREYMRHLRGQGLPAFATDDLQFELMHRKVRRLRDRADHTAAAHELYHQTYWTVLRAYHGSLERHLAALPAPLADALARIGYRAVDSTRLTTLLAAAEDIAALAKEL